ncbi:MAG: TIGR04013 family B12-binding domain/radical SAM domain-containing protein [Oscillospiraceae bacterium]|nr:TIGR04013 family B12-binding domain/radical SAM domain-containing protein [Oscillospiraceae bacterium]
MKSTKLYFYDTPDNKYSVTALLGAMESRSELFEEIDVGFFSRPEELEENESELQRYRRTVLAFSFFSSQLWDIRDMLLRLRPLLQRCGGVTVGGGPHVSGDGERSVTLLGLDYALLGEGEISFPALLSALLRDEDPAGMEGLCCYDRSGKLVNGGMAARVNIDGFDPVSPRFRRYGPLEITRGCPYGCSFCQTGGLCGHQVRHRSLEHIEEVMLRAKELFKLRFFRALTPNALSYGSKNGVEVDLEELEKLLQMLRRVLGEQGQIYMGYFPSEVRPNNVSDETLSLLKRFVCNEDIVIGAQSGSERMLKAAHRGHTAEQVYEAAECLLRHGFVPNVDFICGLPGEGEEDAQKSVEMIERLANEGCRINVHAFMPLPQTRWEAEPAGKVRQCYIDLLRRLTPKNVVYGDWVNQSAQGKKMHRYFTTGEL